MFVVRLLLENKRLLDKLDAAYIAGYADGEGCIASIIHGRKRYGQECFNLDINFTITNTHKESLDWIQSKLEVKSRFTEKKYEVRHRKCWTLIVDTQHEVSRVLLQLYPFLLVKKKNAELALSFLHSRFERKHGSPYSEQELRYFFDLRVATRERKDGKLKYKDKLYNFEEFKLLMSFGNRLNKERYVEWTPETESLLGTDYDRVIAKKLGLSRDKVRNRRDALGIVSYRLSGGKYNIDGIAKPLIVWAKNSGIKHGTVKARLKRGLTLKEALEF